MEPTGSVWVILMGIWLVISTPLKNISQLGLWHSQYDGKNRIHVPNHQLGIVMVKWPKVETYPVEFWPFSHLSSGTARMKFRSWSLGMITSSKMVQLNYSKRHNKSTKRSFAQQKQFGTVKSHEIHLVGGPPWCHGCAWCSRYLGMSAMAGLTFLPIAWKRLAKFPN